MRAQRGSDAHRVAPDDVSSDGGETGHAVDVGELQADATRVKSTSPQERAQANQALERGLAAYHRGAYAAAEQALKEALSLHPFLAPAHLTLGKIYLLRGVAAGDHRRIEKGRRLVEMAIRLDPKNDDAQAFLPLFP